MMGGMLVPVESVPQLREGDLTLSAVDTLFGVDPDFVTLCKTLYGDDVDPRDVWLDVFKMEPAGPDMMTHAGQRSARRRQRRGAKVFKADKNKRDRMAVAAASGVGAVAGGLGFARGVQGARAARAAGRAVSRTDKALLAVEPVGLTGEIGATHILGGDARKQKRGTAVPVAKVSVPGVHAMARGFEAGMRRTLPTVQGAAAKIKPRLSEPVGRVRQVASERPGSTAALGGVAGIGAANMQGRRSQRKKDDSTLNKRAEDIDVVWAGEFSKFDEDKRLVFGYASVVELNGVPVVDRQGDYIHPDDLENASYEYVLKSRVGGDMHRRTAGDTPFKISDLVESVVFTPEKVAKMGLPPDVAEKIPTSWWVGFKVHDDRAWDEVKKGAKAGFSIHGRGKRVPTEMDALVPGYA